MSSNIRGYHSKKEVLANIVHNFCMDIVCIQETHINGAGKINIPGYYSFAKNRQKAGSKGGVAILVREILKDSALLIHESQKSEMIAVKFCQFKPHLVVINYYARQENTASCGAVNEDLTEIFDLANRLTEGGDMVVIAGDWNVSVGAQLLHDNCPEVSKGGKFLNDLLRLNPEFELLNQRHYGSSITHIDASGGRGKCLDMVIGNSRASDATTGFLVDEDKLITPYRYLQRQAERRHTDHLTVHWTMALKKITVNEDDEQYEIWNYNKKLGNGWFAYHLDRDTQKLVKLLDNDKPIDYVMERVKKASDNAKYRGYGKRLVEPGKWETVEDRRIELYRINQVAKAVEKVKADKKNHRVPLQVFAMRKTFLMSERGETFSSVVHPETGKVVETREAVNQAILKHNELTLSQNNNQPECFQRLTNFKLKYLEIAKLQEEKERDETILWEDYLEVMQILVARQKNCYADMKRWGPKFKIFVYWLLKKIYEEETIPAEFLRTKLQALYKGRGSRKDLGNYRFLHLKDGMAKMFETLVMQKCKADLWEGFSETQIGGLPNSRCTEHLYLLVTLMTMIESKASWSPEGVIIIFKDVRKAFDKISAIHTLCSAALCGVKGKILRILEILNKITTFTVVGDPEHREFVKEYVGGQGTVFTATSCSKCMPEPMARLVEARETETGEFLGVKMGPEGIRVNDINFVDDQAALCKDPESARVKGRMVTYAMESLNVETHPVKTKWMAIGNRAFRDKASKELSENPIVIQGHNIAESEAEKYLGMMINAQGRRATIEMQMSHRFAEAATKLNTIRSLLEKPEMRGLGFLAGLRTLFDSVVTATALYSSAAWVGTTRADYQRADREQKRQLFMLLNLSSRCTLLHVLHELDLLSWSWTIKRDKITFVSFLCHTKVGQASRVAVSESQTDLKQGLIHEVRKIADNIGLPDPSKVYLSTEAVGEAVKSAARLEMWESVTSSRTVNKVVLAERYQPMYIYDETLSNLDQKIILCWRLGYAEFKTRYSHKFSNTECIFCSKPDTFEHSLRCPHNPVKKPRSLKDMTEMVRYLKELHRLRLEIIGHGLFYL